jgi:hypothetical protein
MSFRKTMVGCLKSMLVGIAVLVLLGLLLNWVVNESRWKAESAIRQIPVGSSVLELEPILARGTYFHRCVYEMELAGEWKAVTREEFENAVKNHQPGTPQETRVSVMVHGWLIPVIFAVEADGDGRVRNVTEPRSRG